MLKDYVAYRRIRRAITRLQGFCKSWEIRRAYIEVKTSARHFQKHARTYLAHKKLQDMMDSEDPELTKEKKREILLKIIHPERYGHGKIGLTSYILHPTSYILHPTSYILHPLSRWRGRHSTLPSPSASICCWCAPPSPRPPHQQWGALSPTTPHHQAASTARRCHPTGRRSASHAKITPRLPTRRPPQVGYCFPMR